jgi:hypothetical protein
MGSIGSFVSVALPEPHEVMANKAAKKHSMFIFPFIWVIISCKSRHFPHYLTGFAAYNIKKTVFLRPN